MITKTKRRARQRGRRGAQARGRRLPLSPPRGLSSLTAAILAGGLGTRLRPMLADRPKVLAPVHGRPFLVHLLDRLAAAGICKTVLLTGYRAEQIFKTVGETYRVMKLVHSPETEPFGTGGALRHAREKLDSADVLLLNGDSWCDVRLGDFWQFHRRSKAALSMVLARVDDPARFGAVDLRPDGKVLGYKEKQAGGKAWINAGMYLMARSLIEEIPQGPLSLERELLPRWLEQGKRVFAFCQPGMFLDIGTPASYAIAESVVPVIPERA